ncbi:MAG: hypothetical protein NVS3B26_07670 [Mycobacteriales bacterium]
MDYDEAITAFYGSDPAGAVLPEAVRLGSPARRLRDACEPIAMHAIWSRRTSTAMRELGLDFFSAYVAGRAANLGEPSSAVVAATFAWFDPEVLTGVYEATRFAVSREQIIRVRDEATRESLREVLQGEDVEAVADVLTTATAVADTAGRSLFAGLRARGRPADAVHRLWWACDLVREHRGDSHVAAACAAGVGPVEMNVLTELWLGYPLLSYSATRAWPPEALAASVRSLERRGWLSDGRLTPAGAGVRSGIEEKTDDQELEIVEALGGDFDEVCSQLSGWSDLCVAAGLFPPDVLKRAAG